MSGLGWTALGTGALAIGLAIAVAVLAVKLGSARGALATSKIETASARYEVGKLTGERDLVVAELDELRARHTREMDDLRAEVEQCQDLFLEQASDAELREALARATGKRPA